MISKFLKNSKILKYNFNVSKYNICLLRILFLGLFCADAYTCAVVFKGKNVLIFYLYL